MNAQVSPQTASNKSVDQTALSGPLVSRALFWRPRYVRDGAAAFHLPFGFWLAEVVRPTRIIAVGMADGQGYFGLCQALDKLNIAAMCSGFGTWPAVSPDETAQIPAALQMHNKENYSDFSTLRLRDPHAALTPVDDATVDLLRVNLATEFDDINAFLDLALSKLSSTGIIVLHGLHAQHEDSEKQTCLARLAGAHPTLHFGDDDDGIVVILVGKQQDDRLLQFAAMKPGSAELNAIQTVFYQLGAGHYYERQNLQNSRIAQEAQAFAEQAAAERDTLDQQVMTLQSAYAERSKKMAAEQVQLFDLKNEIKELQATLTQKDAHVEEIEKTFVAKQKALEDLTAQVDSTDRKELERQLKARFQELAVLQREMMAIEARTKAQIKTIKSSTSWRITSPLRKMTLLLRSRKKK